MTVVRFFKNHQGIMGFEAKGHAGFADAGQDIVCAAISVLTQTAVIGLEKVVQIKPKVKVRKKDGYLKCMLPNRLSPEAWKECQIIFQVLQAGLQGIVCEYEDFLRIEEV